MGAEVRCGIDCGEASAFLRHPLVCCVAATSQIEFNKSWNFTDWTPADQSGIHYAREFEVGSKRLQVAMLDVRYHRNDPGLHSDV